TAGLTTVDVARDVDDGRVVVRDPGGLGGRHGARVAQVADVLRDRRQARRGHVGRVGDDRVRKRLAGDAGGHDAGGDAVGRGGDRGDVPADLVVGDDPLLADAEREAEERLRARDVGEAGLWVGVTGWTRGIRARGGTVEHRQRAGEEQRRRRT